MSAARRDLQQLMKAEGFCVLRRAGSGHLIWVHPSGVRYVTPHSPSDHRALRNIRADLHRALASISPA